MAREKVKYGSFGSPSGRELQPFKSYHTAIDNHCGGVAPALLLRPAKETNELESALPPKGGSTFSKPPPTICKMRSERPQLTCAPRSRTSTLW